MSKPFQVALAGYGYVGRTFHAPLIVATPGLQLHTVVSTQPQQVLADHPTIAVTPDFAQVLAAPGIDAVVIATPNQTHAPLALQALAAGKHVLVDKPFTTTHAEAKEIAASALHNGRIASVFQNRRWDADFLTVEGLIRDGQLGEIFEFHSHFDRHRPQVRDRWRESDAPGAGLWFDLGPHLLDQALQLFGRPQAISADLHSQREHARSADYFDVTLHYQRMRAHLHAGSLVADHRLRFAVHGLHGSYLKQGTDVQEQQLRDGLQPGAEGWGIDPLRGTLTAIDDDGKTQVSQPANAIGDYRQCYAALRDAMAGSAPPPVTLPDAIEVMELIELAQRSAELGQRLRLA